MPLLDPADLLGPIGVTVAYIGLYYGFQLNVLRVKLALDRDYHSRSEKFDRYFGQDRRMLAADRMQLNTLEHMPPFLVLLWLHAVFVGTTGATIAGALYVAARALYPVVMGQRLGRSPPASIFVATGLGYLCLAYFCYGLVRALVVGLLH